MKLAQKFFAAFFILGLLVGSAGAKDFCETPVVKGWETQRDAVAVNIAQLFLRQASRAVMREEGFELLRLEVLLSSCIPPLKPEDFYLLELENPDPELLPAAVLRGYLRKHGVSIDARSYLTNKTFWMGPK